MRNKILREKRDKILKGKNVKAEEEKKKKLEEDAKKVKKLGDLLFHRNIVDYYKIE